MSSKGQEKKRPAQEEPNAEPKKKRYDSILKSALVMGTVTPKTIADAIKIEQKRPLTVSTRKAAHQYLSARIAKTQSANASSANKAAELDELFGLQIKLYNITKENVIEYIKRIEGSESRSHARYKYLLVSELQDCAETTLEWQANNALSENQKFEAAKILRRAKVACDYEAGKERLQKESFNLDNDKLFKEFEKQANAAIATISKQVGPDEKRKARENKYMLRKKLEEGMEEFLELRSKNAVTTEQREAALKLLDAARDACEKKREVLSAIVDSGSLESRFKALESRKAKRVLANVDILEGSKDWSKILLSRKKWSTYNTRDENAIKAFLTKERNGLSEKQKEEYNEWLKRAKESLQFSSQEKRIIDDCSTLARYRHKSDDEYERRRLELLKKKKEEETLEKAIEAVRKQWEGRFKPYATKETAHDSDSSEADQYSIDAEVELEAVPELSAAELFEAFCTYP